MGGSREVRRGRPVQVAREVMSAIAAGRVEDVMGLVDPQVLWMPASRPARSVYHGHADMARLIEDLHTAYGQYGLDIEAVGTDPCGLPGRRGATRVTARVRVVRETKGGKVTEPPIFAELTVRGGHVTFVQARFAS